MPRHSSRKFCRGRQPGGTDFAPCRAQPVPILAGISLSHTTLGARGACGRVFARAMPREVCNVNLRLQILALAVLPLVLAILTITSFTMWQSASLVRTSIATFEQNMLKAKEAELLHLTDLALSAIAEIYEDAGPDDAAAKEEVRRIFARLDYGPDGYFFVYDYDGANIVHPRQPFRLGR